MTDQIDIPELKARFAADLLRSKDPDGEAFLIASKLVLGNNNLAVEMSRDWPKDPEVLRIQNELIAEHGIESFMPSKLDVMRKLWQLSEGSYVDARDKISALNAYSEIAGYKPPKGASVINNNSNSVTPTTNVVANKVMLVAASETDADWFKRAEKQQDDLMKAGEDAN